MNKILSKINRLLINILISTIKFYQFFLSPLIGSNCRFLPTCSEYSIESIKKLGLIKGSYLSIKRILKCHPLGKKGYDPVIKEK